VSAQLGGRTVSRLLMVGFGLTGRAVAAFCAERGVRCSVSESGPLTPADRSWLTDRGFEFEEGGNTSRFLADADAVVLSPGVSAESPLTRGARRAGIPVHSEIDLATVVGCSGTPVVGVTGTNGKSTTVSLIGAILRAVGREPIVAGNIGLPFIAVVDRAERVDAVVLEVSSFQLEQSLLFRPDVAVLLNLAPNHLDRHRTMEAYAAAKQRIFARQGRRDVAVLPSELEGRIDHGRGSVVFYDRPPLALPTGSEALSHTQRLDLAAALAACGALHPEIDGAALRLADLDAALHLPFRQQEIGRIRGIRVVNDSKSTSAAATIAALESAGDAVVLLLGGRSKKAGYEELARRLHQAPPREVVVFGEACEEIAAHLAAAGVPLARERNLRDAVERGLVSARPGDTLLFSPACSSFDEFSSFEERGAAFERLLKAHSEFAAAPNKDV
jgi:UDP-N-acetylmuramoylalanine--D-glutamate ligase